MRRYASFTVQSGETSLCSDPESKHPRGESSVRQFEKALPERKGENEGATT